MKHLKLFLAFGCGWATVIVLGFVADALAQRTTPLQARIDALADRVKKLELKVTNGTFSRQVAASGRISVARSAALTVAEGSMTSVGCLWWTRMGSLPK